MSMNKVFQIFEEEKQDAIIQTRLGEKKEFAEKLLSDGMEIVKIIKYAGLTRKQIEEIRECVLFLFCNGLPSPVNDSNLKILNQ